MSFQVSVLPSWRQFNVEDNESILAAGIPQEVTLDLELELTGFDGQLIVVNGLPSVW
jgi:hypothetical protein